MKITSQSSGSYNTYSIAADSQQGSSQTDGTEETKRSSSRRRRTENAEKKSMTLAGGIRKNSALQVLNKQLTQLMDYKKTISESAAKSGEDPKTTKQKLDDIDKQIQDIQKQITQMQIEERQKALGTSEEDKEEKAKKSSESKKSKEPSDTAAINMSQEQMGSMIGAADSLEQAGKLMQTRKIMMGEASELGKEIASDLAKGFDPKWMINREAEIQGNLKNVAKKVSKKMDEANEKIKTGNTAEAEKTDKVKKKHSKEEKAEAGASAAAKSSYTKAAEPEEVKSEKLDVRI